VAFTIPARLATACRSIPDGATWLLRLPDALRDLEQRWSLRLGASFDEASCAWVAPVTLANGTTAVLKLAVPHMESEHEIEGLRFWGGDPTVRLLDVASIVWSIATASACAASRRAAWFGVPMVMVRRPLVRW
jgi:streptomycin 6-kinase